MSDELHKYPGNLKHHKVDKNEQRKLLAEMMEDDAKSGLYDAPAGREPLLSDADWQRMDTDYVRDFYEASRAKDAELIQRLVNGLHHAQKFAATYGYGPLETINWDLEAASSAGFKPSEQ